MKTILIITRDPVVSFRQLPGGQGVTSDGRYRFVVNDYDAEADFVVVSGKGLRQPRRFHVAPRHTVLLTGEPYGILAYPRGYCRQFGLVCSCQPGLTGANVVHTPAILPWYVGVGFNADGTVRFTKRYEDIARARPRKTRLVSVISSTKAFSRGHVDRLRFIRRLRERYGDRIDIYGRGFRDFDDKWDVLAPYKYHIVIENSSSDYYFTEKLFDCYLAGTYPIYYGCRNIADYYPAGALTPIDIRRFDVAAATIDRVLDSSAFEDGQGLLAACKELSLDRYNMFNEIGRACDRIGGDAPKEEVLLRPASHYPNGHNLWLHTLGRNYYKLIKNL